MSSRFLGWNWEGLSTFGIIVDGRVLEEDSGKIVETQHSNLDSLVDEFLNWRNYKLENELKIKQTWDITLRAFEDFDQFIFLFLLRLRSESHDHVTKVDLIGSILLLFLLLNK